MTSKNISITEDVYSDLIKIKQSDESFSDIIRRLLEEAKKDPLTHFGILKDESLSLQNDFDSAINKMRETEIKNIKTRNKQLWDGQ